MLFGPFPIFFIERLRSALGDFAPEAKVYSSAAEVAQFREKVRDRAYTPNAHPPVETQEDLLYIEIPSSRLLLVKAELLKMGVQLSEPEFDPEFHRGEYLCPRCAHVSAEPGLCPQHKIRLLEFSAWAA